LVPPNSNPVCFGIDFNISAGTIHIPPAKLSEVTYLCTKTLRKKSISKRSLQALIGSLMFLHKAIKHARTFVNHILALLKQSSDTSNTTSDSGTQLDLRWFIKCSH
jgi:dsRNA-specific ribonuclease